MFRTVLLTSFRNYITAGCTPKMDKKKALVLLATGSEEMELVVSVDVLRRAGVKVTVAGIGGCEPTKCSRDVVILPDKSLEDAECDGPYDAVVLPGGLGGSKQFSCSPEIGKLLKQQESCSKIIAAICAAPTALLAHGIGLGKSLTSYPSVKDELSKSYKYVEENVVVDGNLITSRGPGTAFEFALEIVKHLVGKEMAETVANGMILKKENK